MKHAFTFLDLSQKSELPNILTIVTPRRNPWTKKSYVDEGYKKNPIVYKCVKEIADALSSVSVFALRNDERYNNERLNSILRRPNMRQDWSSFMRDAATFYNIFGDCFFIKFPAVGTPLEIYTISPDLVEIEAARNGDVLSYNVGTSGNKKRFPVDIKTGECQILHIKMSNPNYNDPFGQSPLEAAALAADNHNEGLIWNHSLLKNSACPSGVLESDKMPDAKLTASIIEWFSNTFQGSRGSGKVPFLSGGVKFSPLSLSQKDMDFINTIKQAEKHIASVYGVPLPMIDNDGASYNNMEQAKEKFWTDTILPTLNLFLGELTRWFVKSFDELAVLSYDIDSISALENLRQKRYDKVMKAVQSGLITINEARIELGYDRFEAQSTDAADQLMVNAGLIPIDLTGFDASLPDEASQQSKQAKKNQMLSMGYTDQEIFEALGI